MGHFSAIKWVTFQLTNISHIQRRQANTRIKPTRSARCVSLRVRPNPTVGRLRQTNSKLKNILAL